MTNAATPIKAASTQLTPAWATTPETVPCVKCESCCPSTLCDRSNRNWTAQISALIMFRSNPDAFRYVEDPTAMNSGLDAGDFRFGAQAGIEASVIGHDFMPGRDLEFRYIGVDGWSDSLFAAIAGDPFRINSKPPTFVNGPRDVFATYKSAFHGYELNLRQTVAQQGSCSQTQLLFGFRHLRIDESLRNRLVSTATPPISTEHFNVSTSNDLYGLQLGFDRVLAGDCNFCVEGFGKAGIYANDSSQRSTLANEVTTPPTVFQANGSDTDFAVALETGLSLTYRVNECTSCFLGYRAIWVDGLSLASNQVAHTGLAPGSTNPAIDDDIIYHGLRCGFEFAF